jgi:quercetin dioxygenase-like cupin family protein
MTVLEKPAEAALLAKAGEDPIGRSLYVVGSDISIKISTEDTAGAFAVFEDQTPPQAGPPLHSHRYQDEWWYIRKGRYRFQVDSQIILAGPGDTVFAAKGTRHAFQNIGSETGLTLTGRAGCVFRRAEQGGTAGDGAGSGGRGADFREARSGVARTAAGGEFGKRMTRRIGA